MPRRLVGLDGVEEGRRDLPNVHVALYHGTVQFAIPSGGGIRSIEDFRTPAVEDHEVKVVGRNPETGYTEDIIQAVAVRGERVGKEDGREVEDR